MSVEPEAPAPIPERRVLAPAGSARFGDFEFDAAAHELRRGGRPIAIEGRALQILQLLLEHPGELVLRQQIVAHLWGSDSFVDVEAGINTAIRKLRAALGDDAEAPRYVRTVQGKGYRLVAGVAPPPATMAFAPRLVVRALESASHQLADGFSEDIRTALGRVRSIAVVAKDPTTEASYELDVSVRQAGPQVRIVVTLSEAAGGSLVWREAFDRQLGDLLSIQADVALRVTAAVERAVQEREAAKAALYPPHDLGCYGLSVRAAALRTTLERADVLEAMRLLDMALALDPSSAPALGQAASCYSLAYLNGWTADAGLCRRAGLDMAARAIMAGPGDAAVLAQAANALTELEGGYERPAAVIDRATALNPASAYAWFVSGVIRLMEGDGEQAASHFGNVTRLEPFSKLGEMARAHIAVARAVQGDFEGAVRLFRETTYRTPRVRLAYAAAADALGDTSVAQEELAGYDAASSVPALAMAEAMTRWHSPGAVFRQALMRAAATVRPGGA